MNRAGQKDLHFWIVSAELFTPLCPCISIYLYEFYAMKYKPSEVQNRNTEFVACFFQLTIKCLQIMVNKNKCSEQTNLRNVVVQ